MLLEKRCYVKTIGEYGIIKQQFPIIKVGAFVSNPMLLLEVEREDIIIEGMDCNE